MGFPFQWVLLRSLGSAAQASVGALQHVEFAAGFLTTGPTREVFPLPLIEDTVLSLWNILGSFAIRWPNVCR